MTRSRRRLLLVLIGIVAVIAAVAAYVLIATDLFAPCNLIFMPHPYVQNVHGDRITICWGTDQPTKATICVTDEAGKVLFRQKTPAAADRHEMTVTGLEPGRTYQYTVRSARTIDGTQQASFATAPEPGVPFEFAAWGDSRTGRDTCQRIAGLILDSGVRMAVHTGDFVGDGANPFDWNWMFLEPCRDLLRSVVLWPAIGNHELGDPNSPTSGRDLYTRVFALPGNEFYYSFDYGDAHFLVLDSNPDAWNDPAQLAFAEQDLAATQAHWRFAVFHHPVFNAGAGHESHVQMRTLYCPLFARYNIDLVLTGHDHSYQRSKPIRHQSEPRQQRPYLHLVVAGGGAPLYDVRNDLPWSDVAVKCNHFLLIRIDGDVLTGRAINTDAREFDRFVIDKSAPPPPAVSYEQIEAQRQQQQQTQPQAKWERRIPYPRGWPTSSGGGGRDGGWPTSSGGGGRDDQKASLSPPLSPSPPLRLSAAACQNSCTGCPAPPGAQPCAG